MSYSEIDRLKKLSELIGKVAKKYDTNEETIEQWFFNYLKPEKKTFLSTAESRFEVEFTTAYNETRKLEEREKKAKEKLKEAEIENSDIETEIKRLEKLISIQKQNNDSLNTTLHKYQNQYNQLVELFPLIENNISKVKKELEQLDTERNTLEREKSELQVLSRTKRKENDILEYDNSSLKRTITENIKDPGNEFLKYFLMTTTLIGILLALYFKLIYNK